MNKQNYSLKAITHAHAWVGLVISSVLFIVFFAGSISLFRDNIIAWERAPHLSTQSSTAALSLDNTVTQITNNYDVNMHHRMFLIFPTAHSNYIDAYYGEHIEGGEEHDIHTVHNQHTGEIVGNGSLFDFSNFIYELHINLKIPGYGKYIVGIVTLFFFVALLTGVVIHWRKIIKNFFQYRTKGKKDSYLDAHNLIGVMGLPFHIMYAFTGLVFNLVLVYQIAYAVVLYQGDQDKLLQAAGYGEVHIEETNTPQAMVGLDDLYQDAQTQLGVEKLGYALIEHFGDESASITFRVDDPNFFATKKEIKYLIKDQSVLYKTLDNYDNQVRSGLQVITNLHFGNFAGYGLRILFFILGIATCYIILSGNLMWIEKRMKQRVKNEFGLHFVKAMTSGVFIGFAFAVAIGFILSRILEPDYLLRTQFIQTAFYAILATAIVTSFFIKQQKRFTCLFLQLTAACFAIVPLLDWIVAHQGILQMVKQGYFDIIIVEMMLLILALLLYLIARYSTPKTQTKTEHAFDEIDSSLSTQ